MLERLTAPLVAKIAGGASLLLLIALMICGIGWRTAAGELDDLSEQLRDARAELTLARADAVLKEQAAVERQADAQAIGKAREDLIDEISEVPDTLPDAVRVRLGCERLRRAGYAPGDLPAYCGYGGGGEAGAAARDRDERAGGG